MCVKWAVATSVVKRWTFCSTKMLTKFKKKYCIDMKKLEIVIEYQHALAILYVGSG